MIWWGCCIWGCTYHCSSRQTRLPGWRDSTFDPAITARNPESPHTLHQFNLAFFLHEESATNRHNIIQSPWTGRRERELSAASDVRPMIHDYPVLVCFVAWSWISATQLPFSRPADKKDLYVLYPSSQYVESPLQYLIYIQHKIWGTDRNLRTGRFLGYGRLLEGLWKENGRTSVGCRSGPTASDGMSISLLYSPSSLQPKCIIIILGLRWTSSIPLSPCDTSLLLLFSFAWDTGMDSWAPLCTSTVDGGIFSIDFP